MNEWLVLGQSSKSVATPTLKGRSTVGNKGLGRLAALRLGTKTSIVTRHQDSPKTELRLDIDWKKYEKATVVEDVELVIKERRTKSGDHGTKITVTNLRRNFQRHDVRRLARGLLLLADPFADSKGFLPVLEAPEFTDLEELVKQRYFRDAEFHLVARVNENGTAVAEVRDSKGKLLFEGSHQDIRGKKAQPFACPPAEFNLWAFILNKKTFSSRTSTVSEVRAWLKEFGGVHLYIRGFRVAPYGSPGSDWLDMNLSRVRSPEVRPATNSAIGKIALTDPNETLTQKTDRTGLIEGKEFHELKQFAIEPLDWMAKRRLQAREQKIRDEKSESEKRVNSSKNSMLEEIGELPEGPRKSIEKIFRRYDRAREAHAKTKEKEVQLYRTLSTAGITTSVFAHETRQPVRLIISNANQLTRLTKGLAKAKQEKFARPIGRVHRQAKAMQVFGNLTLNQLDHGKRRAGRVDLHSAIKSTTDLLASLALQRKVTLSLSLDEGEPYLRGSEAAIESVVTNLVTNSLRAIESARPGKHEIEITTLVQEGSLQIRFADSGPGIQGIAVRDIWLPGESTYPNGTGLGLTIVRDTVLDFGGSVEVVDAGKLGGAEFIVNLPILGA